MISKQYIENPTITYMKSLSSGQDFYTIPIYQRSYSWDHNKAVTMVELVFHAGYRKRTQS